MTNRFIRRMSIHIFSFLLFYFTRIKVTNINITIKYNNMNIYLQVCLEISKFNI